MFYIHFDEQGNILSAANHNDAPLYTEVTKEIYEDFIFGRKQFHEYKMAEDIRIKGKMVLVPVEYDSSSEDEHQSGKIKQDANIDSGIQILQNKTHFILNNYMDHNIQLQLSAGKDYYKEYYIVNNKNRYILLETFRINLKKFALKDSIKIKNKHKDKKVAILTHGSHIPHVHITED